MVGHAIAQEFGSSSCSYMLNNSIHWSCQKCRSISVSCRPISVSCRPVPKSSISHLGQMMSSMAVGHGETFQGYILGRQENVAVGCLVQPCMHTYVSSGTDRSAATLRALVPFKKFTCIQAMTWMRWISMKGSQLVLHTSPKATYIASLAAATSSIRASYCAIQQFVPLVYTWFCLANLACDGSCLSCNSKLPQHPTTSASFTNQTAVLPNCT